MKTRSLQIVGCVLAAFVACASTAEAKKGKNVVAKKTGAYAGGGDGNTATGDYSVVSGGSNNAATATFSTIGGGFANTASGLSSTVPGGQSNTSDGDFSLAAGHRAKAAHDGSFVWGDSTDADFSSTTSNQFRLRANGGVDLQTDGAGLMLDGGEIKPLIAGDGIAFSGAGTFLTISVTTNLVPLTRIITAGNGLLGGGSLQSNITLSINPAIVVTSGAPVTSLANTVGYVSNGQSGVTLSGTFSGNGGGITNLVPVSRAVSAGSGLLGGGTLSGDIALAINPAVVVTAGAPVSVFGNDAGYLTNMQPGVTLLGDFTGLFSGDGSGLTNVVPFTRTVTAGAGLLGGGALSSNVTLAINPAVVVTAGAPVSALANNAGYVSNTQSDVNLTGTFGGSFVGGIVSNVTKIVVASNIPSGTNAVVGGGLTNTASATSATVGGGQFNTASGTNSVIGGGDANLASGNEATVAGGTMNTASADNSTVGGGLDNTASGAYATVAGGSNNVASGIAAMVAGGISNVASGNFSFAAGSGASATNDGSFVWADASIGAAFASTSNNQFNVRADGGALIYSVSNLTAGVELLHGDGSWSTISDRNVKENFKPVDTRALLEKLSQVPITEWNMKSQDPSIRHIGPMAQDFKAAFGVGSNERRITTTDADGVALAAIQGLYQLLLEQKEQLAKKDAQIAELEQQHREQARQLQTQLDELRALFVPTSVEAGSD